MKEVDVIIVGKGLAGTCLALQLIKRGLSIIIFDNAFRSSTNVAAGLYNPITGRKMVKTWQADKLFPYLLSFYRSIEEQANSKFLYETGIYRPFRSVEEQNEWAGKSASDEYHQFIESISNSSQYSRVQDFFGGVNLKMAGYLNTNDFLKSTSRMLGENVCYDGFEYDQVEISEDSINYGAYSARHLICCDGVSATTNNLFDWLPFSPVKGELLEIECELDIDTIVNRGVFIIQMSESSYKVGSNYDNHDHTWSVTDAALQEIEGKLNELINVPFKVIDQHAGVRPATKDRKPFLGMHPKYKNVGIFNGLGAKGVSLAPYYSSQLAHHITNQIELDKEVDISRYYSYCTE